MASRSLGEVILFPVAKRYCFDCRYYFELVDNSGVSSFCALFDEEIHDEGIADTCEDWLQ